MTVSDEHVITRQGKRMILYGGLLSEAHEMGLKSIDTELLQIPDEANGNVAITKARVTLEDGRYFSGLGDASPENVGRAIIPHLVRMSETRSKARALRDAVNVGDLTIDGDVEDTDDSQSGGAPRSNTQQRPARQQGASSGERVAGGATKKQIGYIAKLGKDIFGESEGVKIVEENIGHPLEETSAKDASDIIKRLTAKKEEEE